MRPYYQDDLVTLYHGDCREVAEWLTADVLVTDPPYGISWTQRKGKSTGAGYSEVTRAVANDTDTAARDLALSAWGDRPAVVFGSWKQPRPARVRARLIWDKRGANPGPLNAPFYSVDEEIYILGSGFRKSSPPQRSVITTTEQRSQAVKDAGHPTPKPVPLMELLLDRCPPGMIADPFAGSGSTLLAARNQGRKAVGVELVERYCEIAASHLSQTTLNFGGAA